MMHIYKYIYYSCDSLLLLFFAIIYLFIIFRLFEVDGFIARKRKEYFYSLIYFSIVCFYFVFRFFIIHWKTNYFFARSVLIRFLFLFFLYGNNSLCACFSKLSHFVLVLF